MIGKYPGVARAPGVGRGARRGSAPVPQHAEIARLPCSVMGKSAKHGQPGTAVCWS